jgi:RNA polymerase sigma-70 factor (ECF subfamily)
MDDSSLIEATLAGNVEAFGTLVDRYQHLLVASARHLTRNAEDAEDLAQEALVDAYRSLRALKDHGKFRAWVFGILRHKCLTYLQQRKPEPLPLSDVADSLPMPAAEMGGDLAELLDGLPVAYREILAARYVQELSYEEIAEALGTSVNNVRVRCCRARERLRELFAARGMRVEGGVSC